MHSKHNAQKDTERVNQRTPRDINSQDINFYKSLRSTNDIALELKEKISFLTLTEDNIKDSEFIRSQGSRRVC